MIGWRAEQEIPNCLAMAAYAALREIGEFSVSEDNWQMVVHKMADQGILYREYDDGSKKNLYEIALDDYAEYLEVSGELREKLMGFVYWYNCPNLDNPI